MADIVNVTTFLIVVGGLFYRALVVQILWMWFVVPTFHVELLTYGTAWGLLLLRDVLAPASSDPRTSETEEQRASRRFFAAIGILISWSLALGISWFIAGGHHGS